MYGVVIIILFMPAVFGGVNNAILNVTTRVVGIRKDNVSAFIDKEYADDFKKLNIKIENSGEKRIFIEKCTILSNGVGGDAYIQFRSLDSKIKKIQIPSNKIIIAESVGDKNSNYAQ